MIDGWINKGSGWNVESFESQYINISNILTFPLIGPYQEAVIWTYLLRSPKKYQSKLKTKTKNIFYGVMLDILILQKSIQKELKRLTKNC